MNISLLAQFNVEYNIQLANALSKKEDVTLILWRNLSERYLQYLDKSLKVEYIAKPRQKSPMNLNLVYETVDRIKRLNPDIVHMQNPYSWMCIGLPLIKKYPLVLTVHDPVPHFGREQIHSKFTTSFTMRYAKRVIVHGQRMKELVTSNFEFPAENIRIIPHGDFSFFAQSDASHEEEENTILYFGRIWDYKGLEYLIKAEPLISKDVPDAKIIIAGSGDFRRYRGLIVNEKNFVIINEFIPNEKVQELFQKASVVVLPYIEGSQSGIIPIAYSFKKPVVVTDVGSIPEVVDDGKTGYVVPPRDSARLASALVDILSDKAKKKRFGENAYEKMRTELSWDSIADKTIEVYGEIL
jgi:glycosyltransferase involved in cell wall biosynthesis